MPPWPRTTIDVGDQIDGLAIGSFGHEIERNPLFPNRTNVSFIRVDGSRVRARIFERGVGETLASGTGASGAAVAAVVAGAASPVAVALDGGELTVEVTDALEVTLTGTAGRVYAGELDAAFVAALADA